MSIDNLKRVTRLPTIPPDELEQRPPNLARDVQTFIGGFLGAITKPLDMLNFGVAKLGQWTGLEKAIGSRPAARLYRDYVRGFPHGHTHPPFVMPPSTGIVVCAGARNVLINGEPAARTGDMGFAAWCGGWVPIFEVLTGSSSVFIGGARASRQSIDITLHCFPNPLSKAGLIISGVAMAFSAGMGALGYFAAAIDLENYQELAESADSEEFAAMMEAEAKAAGIGAEKAKEQTLADLAAMAMSLLMGLDPGVPPFLCLGRFVSGSPNVLIGGFPMPGWDMILRGLGKLIRPLARRLQLKVPPGSLRARMLCLITGHPVDIASGRVFTTQTDFELPGRIPIKFARAYDSSAVDYESQLGRGWIHPYDIHLWEDDEQGMVILRTEEGMLVGFDLIEVGGKAFNPLEKQWLERLEDKVYVARGKDGARYKFASIKGQDSVIEVVDDSDGKSEAKALRLSEIEDRNGNKVRLFYEGGRLGQLVDSAGTRLNFSYITLDNGAERLAGVNMALDENSARTARLVNFSYDSEGRLTNATDRGLVPWRYAYDGDLLVRETNRNGLSFHFAYKGEGREARCVHTWGDGGIYERWLDYDRESRMTVVENSLGAKTRYYFNELYLPVRIVDALGGEELFSYGPNGELLSETDQIGRETKYLFNAQYDCISITHPDGTTHRFENNSDSLPERLTDETGAEFRREYDERGNIIAAIDALGHRREYGYNQFGDLEKAVDPLGGVTKFKWNERGQVIEFTSPLGATTRYSYDERGRLVMVSDPLGHAARYAYDASDRLTQVERPDGAKRRYEYDPEGNLTHFRDANGSETRFRYVDYHELGERIDALGYTRRYIYDTEANLIEIRNERSEAYKFTYDALDRVTREVGFDGLKSEYDYDPAGQLIARVDPAGRVTRFILDLRGRMIERRRPDGTAISFSYDSGGRMTEADAPGSELEFKYDALGRVMSESQNGKVIEYAYDPLGRRIKRRSPSDQMVEFTYDADGNLRRLQTPRGSMEFEYDKAGRLTKQRLPGALEESFYYDRCGRIIEQSLDKKRSHALFHRGYKYDAEGSLIEMSDSNNGVSRFVYDPVERLREALQPEKKAERFTYDSTGNLLRRGEKEFRYDAPDRLAETNDAALIYDEVGNLIEKRRAGSVIRYSYDPDNRLIAVESKEGGRIEFVYDALGRRIAKTTKDGATGFIWDEDVLMIEESGNGTSEYVFWRGSYEPLCRFDEAGFETYHNDHLGTPRELTDAEGRLIWSATYDVYCQTSPSPSNEVENQIRYKGQYEDYETGLYYNHHRYFDPESGRYITKDPIGLWGGLNNYEYTRNPINWVDPLGLSGTCIHKGTGDTRVNRFIEELRFAVAHATRMLDAGKTGGTVWGRLYHSRFKGTDLELMARGNAIQQISESIVLRGGALRDLRSAGIGVIFNEGSVADLRSANGNLLRPDVQVVMPNNTLHVIDITTPGQAAGGKITKYQDPGGRTRGLVDVTH
jgi:RHS repeat-associated protein